MATSHLIPLSFNQLMSLVLFCIQFGKVSIISSLVGISCFLSLSFFFVPDLQAGGSIERTVAVLQEIPGVTNEQVDKGRELIADLDYFNMRVFRALCKLKDISAEDALNILPEISGKEITFYHLDFFELFCSLKGLSWQMGLIGLEGIRELDFTAVTVSTSLLKVPSIKPEQVLDGIQKIKMMTNPERWATKSFFEIKEQSPERIDLGIEQISMLTHEQCWAVEGSNKIKGITVDQALKNMRAIRFVPIAETWNVRALFNLPDMTGTESLHWLETYFVKTQEEKNKIYLTLTNDQKATLLAVFYEASEKIIIEINNLHSITDINEREIPSAELASYSFEQLSDLLDRLDTKIVDKYGPKFANFTTKGDKDGAIKILREATGAARILAAKQRTNANLYVLLSRITILYDSSFNSILLPVLQKHIAAEYGGSLLKFLQDIDPESYHVARFFSSLGLKGKLGVFIPKEAAEQEKILNLVADSAFRDEHSLIFYAASFTKPLDIIHSSARQNLLKRVVAKAHDKNAIFAQQIRVILQYYLEEQPEFLGQEVKAEIEKILETYGEVDLAAYAKTDFAEWVEDGRLSALSVFNSDDDGRLSFFANCRHLLSNDYQPIPTKSFWLEGEDYGQDDRVIVLLEAVAKRKPESLGNLFKFLKDNSVVIDFVKTVNSIEISHSIAIYRDKETEIKLLEQYVTGNHEMFAHRGHSYWLDDHLLIPLRELVKSESIKRENFTAKQRFLSIGSCGAINAYSELTSIFCNKVDLLGSMGTGMTGVNNLYNHFLFETIAAGPIDMSWREVDRRSSFIFKGEAERSYLLPGGLPAVLYKIVGEKRCWFR